MMIVAAVSTVPYKRLQRRGDQHIRPPEVRKYVRIASVITPRYLGPGDIPEPTRHWRALMCRGPAGAHVSPRKSAGRQSDRSRAGSSR